MALNVAPTIINFCPELHFSEPANATFLAASSLDAVQCSVLPFEQLMTQEIDCPIQQGLADENPDVDAIYRLLLPLPQSFRKDRRVALGSGAWCPFNSQNTTWWPDAFPLLYLPVHCSFRMTDIWRSFVAQRIAWENGWHVLFHEPTMWQERNEHDLMRDFADEVPGYLHNDRIRKVLENTSLVGGVANLTRDLRKCYESLIVGTRAEQFARDVALMRHRWLPILNADPFYNRNLSLEQAYRLAFPPRFPIEDKLPGCRKTQR